MYPRADARAVRGVGIDLMAAPNPCEPERAKMALQEVDEKAPSPQEVDQQVRERTVVAAVVSVDLLAPACQRAQG